MDATTQQLAASARSRIDTIVFDLDGTLIDSAPEIARAANTTLANYGHEPLPLAQVISFIGNGAPMLLRRAFAARGVALTDAAIPTLHDEFQRHYIAQEVNPEQFYPDVKNVLDELKARAFKIAICTNKSQASTDALAPTLGLDRWFSVFIGGDARSFRKPDGRHVLEALHRVGGDPDRAVMVGDSAADISAARDARMPSILVSYGYRREPANALGATVIIDRFGELPAALDRIARSMERGTTTP